MTPQITTPWRLMLAIGLVTPAVLAGPNLGADDFAWRATLSVPPGAPVVRVALPADALLHMQSPLSADLRVFNAAGATVPHAVWAPDAHPALAVVLTRSYPAYALFDARPNPLHTTDVLQLRLDRGAQGDTVWAHLAAQAGGAPTPQPQPQALPSVLFDTRNEVQTLAALQLQVQLPANTLVPIIVETSADLTHWQTVPTQAPLFRFEGEGAPVSETLQLLSPLHLEGKYLRLSWPPQHRVALSSLLGRPVSAAAVVPRPSTLLPAARVEAGSSQIWPLTFGTPVAELHLLTHTPNTWLALQVQGRLDGAQPWANLGNTVVFRWDAQGQTHSNPPMRLPATSARWLRVQTVNGMSLPPQGLQARIAFDPVTVAFVANGSPPFTLAVGRPNTPAAAVDREGLLSSLPGRPQDLPWAAVQAVSTDAATPLPSWLVGVLPAGFALRDVVLWTVLVAGVLSLAAVALALVRQLKSKSSSTS